MNYSPVEERYDKMEYRKCGNSGLKLSAISLGLWHNIGYDSSFENSKNLIQTAFDKGTAKSELEKINSILL